LPDATLTPSFGSNILVWSVVNGKCANSDTVEVTYKNDGSCLNVLELPTGFSPNGDQFNPAYVIHGIEAFPENNFKVFNRWGNEVFAIDNYKNLPGNQASWNGQNQSGDLLPEGTYFVVLIIKNSDIKKNTYVDLRR
jgi:gliding motility-associated-like protein